MKKDMINGKTESGFAFSIKKNALDDYELVEMIAELDGGKQQNLPKIIENVLGIEQKKALMEHLRNEEGKVPFTAMTKAFFEIMGAIKEGKN